MKNQYFGDINDYRKYGLLRQCAAAGLEITVAWMLTPDDGSSDGRRLDYLSKPEAWEQYDPRLFASLKALLSAPIKRSVGLVENDWSLPGTRFHGELVPQSVDARRRWLEGLLHRAQGSDLVFLDPDIGLEVPSSPMGTSRAGQYVYWTEVVALFQAGFSLLIYQHFPRRKRSEFIREMVSRTAEQTGAPAVTAFETANVLFLVAAQAHHAGAVASVTHSVSARWRGQFSIHGDPELPPKPASWERRGPGGA